MVVAGGAATAMNWRKRAVGLNDQAMNEPIVIRCRGHAAIKASDPRAIEVIDADGWAARDGAIGYAASFAPEALDRLRGRVRVEIAAGGASDRFEATISPQYHRGQPLIFRREPMARIKAFAYQSSKAAADLSRPLIEAMRSPDAEIVLSLTQLEEPPPPGVLFLVGMPIGNQADLSPRALDVLASVDLILAEDTRVAHEGLAWRGIRTPLRSCFSHNEKARAAEAAERLARGERLALVTDAGMPSVSDPGQEVVAAAVAAGALVKVIPGPSAALAALAISGLPANPFRVAGFPPRQESLRAATVAALAVAGETTILFESPRRVADLLQRIGAAMPARAVVVCRDLTKQSEQVWRGTASQVASALVAAGELAGEFTLVVAPAPPAAPTGTQAADPEWTALLRALLAEDVPASALARALRSATGMGRTEAYALVHKLKGEPAD